MNVDVVSANKHGPRYDHKIAGFDNLTRFAPFAIFLDLFDGPTDVK